VVLATALTAALLAASPSLSEEELLGRAESAFAEGVRLRADPAKARPLFRTAAELYGELHERGARSAALHRNEGNAWLLAGELPRAILAYQRGLRLAPSDRGLQEGLAFARDRVHYSTRGRFARPPVEHRPPWLPRVGMSNGSFAVLLAGYALSWVALARWRMTRRGRLLGLGVCGLALTAAAATLLGLATYYEERPHRLPLVVIARDGVVLRRGNGEAYPPRHEAPLHRGVEARLLFRRGDWLQVELSGGEVGWVPAAAALVDSST
jgi:tetratricopeptide (TPR) repeat protein